jgi:hypothetical protein
VRAKELSLGQNFKTKDCGNDRFCVIKIEKDQQQKIIKIKGVLEFLNKTSWFRTSHMRIFKPNDEVIFY